MSLQTGLNRFTLLPGTTDTDTLTLYHSHSGVHKPSTQFRYKKLSSILNSIQCLDVANIKPVQARLVPSPLKVTAVPADPTGTNLSPPIEISSPIFVGVHFGALKHWYESL